LWRTRDWFASWNIDSSRNRLFFDVSFSDPQLRYLASAIGGARLRFGGTGNDALYYGLGSAPPCATTVPDVYECLNQTTWDALVAFSADAAAPLVVGLNIHPANTTSPPAGPWDPTNARALLEYARTGQQAIYALELGNEQNQAMSAADQAAALRVLDALVADVYGGDSERPLLVGPDTHSFKGPSNNAVVLAYLQAYVTAAAPVLSAVTHHEYIEITAENVLNATFLDISADVAAQVMGAVRAVNSTIEVWAGEVRAFQCAPEQRCMERKPLAP